MAIRYGNVGQGALTAAMAKSSGEAISRQRAAELAQRLAEQEAERRAQLEQFQMNLEARQQESQMELQAKKEQFQLNLQAEREMKMIDYTMDMEKYKRSKEWDIEKMEIASRLDFEKDEKTRLQKEQMYETKKKAILDAVELTPEQKKQLSAKLDMEYIGATSTAQEFGKEEKTPVGIQTMMERYRLKTEEEKEDQAEAFDAIDRMDISPLEKEEMKNKYVARKSGVPIPTSEFGTEPEAQKPTTIKQIIETQKELQKYNPSFKKGGKTGLAIIDEDGDLVRWATESDRTFYNLLNSTMQQMITGGTNTVAPTSKQSVAPEVGTKRLINGISYVVKNGPQGLGWYKE